MNRQIRQAAATLVTAAAVLISLPGCGGQSQAKPGNTPAPPSTEASSTAPGAADHAFTIRYSADSTFNPITGTDPNNMYLAPLMYEGLFVNNDKLAMEPVLCESYTNEGSAYTFKLKSGIAMSDGSTLTSADVKYTLTQAMESGRYAGRLTIIDTITVVDPLTVKITLSRTNYRLPLLLDIPIIKANSIDQNHPPGTGPYIFTQGDSPKLVASPKYRDYAKLPFPEIQLRSCTDAELSVDFSSQAIDMFWDDPTDSDDINILSDHEVRYYSTTILEYVGFNARNSALNSAQLRHAIGLVVDRNKIIRNVYSNHALPAPLLLSSNYSQYNTAWESKTNDTLGSISAIFSTLGLKDDNSDGFLEVPSSTGGYAPITLTFIVNGDNSYKVQAAQEISKSLKEVGINVTLTPLRWSEYLSTLKSGAFDLYYGDVSLPASFDFTQLLSSGGSLDFGHTGSAQYTESINAFLSASDADSQKAAAQQLCSLVSDNAPIIPVLYKEYALHTNRNAISGLDPTQSSLFYGLINWKINLG